MDLELLEAVLGRSADNLSFKPGWLDGYVVQTASGYTFPTLVEQRHGRVDGVVTAGLTNEDVARIAYFEDTEYEAVTVEVTTTESDIAAQVFMAQTSLRTTGETWRFDLWRKRDKPLLLAVTRHVMAEHYGVTPLEEIDAHWHRIKVEIEAGTHAPARLRANRALRTATAPHRIARKQAIPKR